jgi:transposase
MEPQAAPTFVGIDVAARTLAVAVLPPGGASATAATVANGAAGWRELAAGRRAGGARPATAQLVLEATGSSWGGAATALHEAGWRVSVVSPASARYSAQARLRRAKTDAVDAATLAQYGRDLRPPLWAPPPAEVQALQLPVRQPDDLVAMRTRTRNRRHALRQLPSVPPEVLAPLEAVLAVLRQQIAALDDLLARRAAAAAPLAEDVARLTSIKGVGLSTALVLLTAAGLLRAQASPRQVVASAGLDPAPRASGSSVRGQPRISKTGSARLRQALHMAAVSAARCNPTFRSFYQRLLASGKPKVPALTAVARELLVVMVTLLQHRRTFDPDWAAHHPPRRP